MLLLSSALTPKAAAISFDLDSIAAWGKFPRFCVGVYRWGDRFFNTYDSAYVVGTGYKFNLKFKADSWLDYYNFNLPNSMRMSMVSHPSTSTGLWLTYMAVSVGYDVNVSKYFTGNDAVRKRLGFNFSCSLFSAEAYMISNDVGTRITRFGPRGSTQSYDIDFKGINTQMWGLDVYYFFNHKRYSQAAAFNYSKIQRRSQGSFYAGFSIFYQKFDFDFSSLPQFMLSALPPDWPDYRYFVRSHNYSLRLGYGYNWVPGRRNFVLSISEAPVVGIKKGYSSEADHEGKLSFSLINKLKASAMWNSGRWFAGMIGTMDLGIVYNKEYTLASSFMSLEAAVGFRFNLW